MEKFLIKKDFVNAKFLFYLFNISTLTVLIHHILIIVFTISVLKIEVISTAGYKIITKSTLYILLFCMICFFFSIFLSRDYIIQRKRLVFLDIFVQMSFALILASVTFF